ncbi:thioesterase family protein [Orbaceae bacterium ESL0721]|nr:thioesterase family protein [Orbaceae bacterium ESL0721]
MKHNDIEKACIEENNQNYLVQIDIIPSFHDTDAMGVVWHGNYLKFFEKAREVLFRKFNYGYQEMIDSGYIWPVIDTRLKYIAPTYAEQNLLVIAELKEFENRVKIDYTIFDAISHKKVTSGYTIQVAVAIETEEMSFIIPDIFLQKFGLPL